MSAVSQTPLSPETHARLAAFLGALPAAAAVKLFAALEADRARGGGGLPHDELLEELRRALKAQGRAFPDRPKTAQRLFFTPFEDFFVGRRSGRKRRARIARATLAPMWAVMMDDPACAGAREAALALDAAIVAGKSDLAALEDALFNAAGQGLARLVAHAETSERFRDDLADRLGGVPALHDLAEIHFLLSAVDHLRAMQKAFPKPLAGFTEEQVFEARRLYEAARRDAPEAAPWLLMGLAARMEKPWRALRLHYHLAAAAEGEAAPAGAIAEILFEDLENAARLLERGAEGAFDAEDARLQVAHFADFADGMNEEARRTNDNVVINRVEACRDIAGDCLERFAEQSLAALRRAMPVRQAGGSSRLMAFRPDIAREVSPPAANAARAAAQFLSGALTLAQRLGRNDATEAIIADAVDEARRYLADLVVEIRAAEGDERMSARRVMERALDFAAPLFTPSEIGLFRDRARAAALTA